MNFPITVGDICADGFLILIEELKLHAGNGFSRFRIRFFNPDRCQRIVLPFNELVIAPIQRNFSYIGIQCIAFQCIGFSDEIGACGEFIFQIDFTLSIGVMLSIGLAVLTHNGKFHIFHWFTCDTVSLGYTKCRILIVFKFHHRGCIALYLYVLADCGIKAIAFGCRCFLYHIPIGFHIRNGDSAVCGGDIFTNIGAVNFSYLELCTLQRFLCFSVYLLNDKAVMRLIEKFQRVNSAFFNINRLCSIIKKIPLLCLYLLYDIAANQLWNINTACFIGAIFTIRLTDYRTFDVCYLKDNITQRFFCHSIHLFNQQTA